MNNLIIVHWIENNLVQTHGVFYTLLQVGKIYIIYPPLQFILIRRFISYLAYYPETPDKATQNQMQQFLLAFAKFYPCEDCSEDFKQRLAKTPPDTQSRTALSQWLCGMHNQVNKKLGKNQFDCTLVDQRWRDGWKDGSCDWIKHKPV